MRYKIKTPNKKLFHEVQTLLGNKVRVFVASEKRGLLSTESIPDGLATRIIARGATITPEHQYDLDAPGPALIK